MTVSFKTFGCRLNRAETAQFEAGFAAAGFLRVPFGTPADCIVIHTCAVTQSAESESLKTIRSLRKKEPRAFLVLAGCAVETAGAETLRSLGIDLVVPRDQKDRLADFVTRHLRTSGHVCPPPSHAAPLVPSRSTKRASLKIQDGCDFFCTYCIVPHTRGQPRSHPFEACLDEARALIHAGFHEIVVTGCNIACYADGNRTLVDLLDALTDLPGLGRLRLGSIEPGTVERDVIAFMTDSPKLCKFLHLPIQSGDDGILASMRRRYTVDAVSQTVREALHRMPYLGLGADIIVGFPGETPAAFENTRALLEELPFSNLHIFPYSERPGTPASTFGGAVPEPERKSRVAELNHLKALKRADFAQRFIGRAVDVLVEHIDDAGLAHGWTGEYLSCRISGLSEAHITRLVTCVPHASEKGMLIARLP